MERRYLVTRTRTLATLMSGVLLGSWTLKMMLEQIWRRVAVSRRVMSWASRCWNSYVPRPSGESDKRRGCRTTIDQSHTFSGSKVGLDSRHTSSGRRASSHTLFSSILPRDPSFASRALCASPLRLRDRCTSRC